MTSYTVTTLYSTEEVKRMGEYARLNMMLEGYEEALELAKEQNADAEDIMDIEQSIGEIKGALLEMAYVDGLDDPYEAFGY